jgi:hypothetical protein
MGDQREREREREREIMMAEITPLSSARLGTLRSEILLGARRNCDAC